MKKLLILIIVLSASIISHSVYGQASKKFIQVNRISKDDKINIDGFLNDAAWAKSEIATDFIQTDPVFQDPVSQKTEVKILYTDRGIYVGAMMYDTDPGMILKELSPRDQRGNTDWFGVVFDTYQDGLNGFSFNVTASGVQQDIKIAAGNEDANWDAIWDSEVQFLDNGWSVELFIPYLSLRFANADIQNWNVQFIREIRRFRENVYWNPVNPAIDGFLNQAGQLGGISNIESPVRLSITPFVTGYVNTVGNPSINQATEITPAYTGGMDLKYGINDAFTLDMTVVPDFGQVIFDNEVLNLSPFEIQFDENRQFFKEGTELFDKGNLFYTRRVGGRPLNYFSAFSGLQQNEIVTENPLQAQLYNATKVSGRTSSGTGLGIFNAVEGKEYAVIRNTVSGEQRRLQTNPLTNYNVIVADQNLPNNSVVTLINTNVTRFGDDYDANVTGAFFSLRNKSQTYALGGKVAVANQFFENETNTGHTYSLSAAKISGNWQAEVSYNEESDNYNPNDLGILFSPNERAVYSEVSYNQFKPGNDKIQRWEIGLSQNYDRLYSPNKFVNYGVGLRGFVLWKSRNAIGGNIRYEPFTSFDYFEPRTSDFSKFYEFPTSFSASAFFSSDYRKTLALDIRGFYRKFGEEGRQFTNIDISPRVRVNDQLSFFLTTNYTISKNENGYVNTAFTLQEIEGITGNDVMYGTRDRSTFDNSLRVQYIFNNKMSLSTRIRHNWDQVQYVKFSRLEDNGSLTDLAFDGKFDNGQDIYDVNFNFFTLDLNYTWRFTKGSDIIVVWKNNISGSDRNFDNNYFSNFSNLFDYRQTNSISLKIVYFLDYDSVVNG